MPPITAEVLGEKAARARQRNALDDEDRAEQKRRDKRNARRRQRRRIASFVDEKAPVEIKIIQDKAVRSAEFGDTTTSTRWVIGGEKHDPKFREDLEKYQKLAQRIGEHFSRLAYSVEVVENRPTHNNPNISIVDGYDPSHLPQVDSGYTELSLIIGWGAAETEVGS